MTAEPNGAPATTEIGGSTRRALLSAGLECWAEEGYSGARLVDIAQRAGLTTGAFYRYFTGKLPFFHALFDEYADDLLAALNSQAVFLDQCRAWINIARYYTGVLRAAGEVALPHTDEAEARRRLRTTTANLLGRHLTAAGSWRQTHREALMLVDILDQYMLMEAAGWIHRRDTDDIARSLSRLVERGLYET